MDFCTGAWTCWWDSILSLMSPHSGKICINLKRVRRSKTQGLPPGLERSSRGERTAGWWTSHVVSSHVYYDNLDSTDNTLQWHGPLSLSLPPCSPPYFTQCLADGNPSDVDVGSREYQNASADGFQIAMGPSGNQASGQKCPCPKLWLTPGRRARYSSCSWWMTTWFCKQM